MQFSGTISLIYLCVKKGAYSKGRLSVFDNVGLKTTC